MRLFVTGVSGYLGGVILGHLENDPEIEEIVGVDLRPPSFHSSKLDFHGLDVRDSSIREYMKGADVVLHMAFILDEIKDKEETNDININGSKNVFHSCLDTGTPWLIHISSMAAYGAHPDNPVPLTEKDFPRGDPLNYYSYAKAELEHYLQWLTLRHPELEVTILRPTVIAGANIDNFVSWMFSQRLAASLMGHDSLAQYISEEDLARAVQLVLHHRARGVYNLVSDDCMLVSEMMKRANVICLPVPVNLACRLTDLLFKLGRSRISSHWVRQFIYPMVGTSDKIKGELGWYPNKTTGELLDEVLKAGRR